MFSRTPLSRHPTSSSALRCSLSSGMFSVALFLVLLPFKLLNAGLISYFAIGLHPGASHFFRFLAILFLAVYAAESQVRYTALLCTLEEVRLLIVFRCTIVYSCRRYPPDLRGSARRGIVHEWYVLIAPHASSVLQLMQSSPGFWMVSSTATRRMEP